MGIKFVEYKAKWEHGLLPGTHFAPHDDHQPVAETLAAETGKPAVPVLPVPAAAPSQPGVLVVETSRIAAAATGPTGTVTSESSAEAAAAQAHLHKRPSNVQIFFGIYFLMTGLHGIHVLGGMAAIFWLLVRSIRGDFTPDYFTPVDFVGLYWHLVDLIWIFLFPLLYLIG